jgi:hypothetical protein
VVATTETARQTERERLRRQNAKPVAGSFSSAYKERDCRTGTKNSRNRGELGSSCWRARQKDNWRPGREAAAREVWWERERSEGDRWEAEDDDDARGEEAAAAASSSLFL